ncbi:MAG TPA: agmatinase [Gemmatimonadaceae bacterium]|nr:agmatinase [Gemmatimonadaceae bacterium]
MTPTLIGVPFDAASSFLRGAAAAPAAIRRELASEAGNGVSEALIDLRAPGALADAGDIALSPTGDPTVEISNAILGVLARDGRPISLGGDHSITLPVVRALRTHWRELTIVQFDAHPDLYDVFEGDRLSHACPFARIMEGAHADRLVQVGIRAMNSHQLAQADRFGVDVIDMRAWTGGTRPVVRGPVYVSVDLDGLDPAFAPGVSHREPGGLSVRDILGVIQTLEGPIVGADVVEYNPSRDVGDLTSHVCAKLVRELASRMWETNPSST